MLLIFFAGSLAACGPAETMVKRSADGTYTLTPFLSKATFTSTNTPINVSGEKMLSNPSLTATADPALTEQPGGSTATGQAEAAASSTPTPGSSPAGSSPTPQPDQPTSTTKPAQPTNTTKPKQATNTPKPAQPTDTQKPAQATNTPNSPPATDTPAPATATTALTNTAVPTATSAPTATAEPQGCSFSGNAGYENQVVELINQERADRGLSALVQKSSLREAARRHSQDMACNDFFSHTGSDGSTLSSRLQDAGYNFTWAAENIAASSSSNFSAQSVVSMWMNSSGHRKNILSEQAKHIGVGFRYAGDGNSQDLDAYYTADFGRR